MNATIENQTLVLVPAFNNYTYLNLTKSLFVITPQIQIQIRTKYVIFGTTAEVELYVFLLTVHKLTVLNFVGQFKL